jgi:hypothetical protein
VLPTLGKTFRPFRQKNSVAEKKIRPPTNFLTGFEMMTIFYLCLGAWKKFKISLICIELERIKGEKLSALNVENWKKIQPQLCPALYFLFSPFF